jgi:hypothetical protein
MEDTVWSAGRALARDNGHREDQPVAIREWFRFLMQPDHPRVSCRGEADAFEADQFAVGDDHYVAVITNGKASCREGQVYCVAPGGV